MKYDLVIFDLDGTLVDSFADIHFSVNLLLASLGGSGLDATTVRGFIGQGVRHLITRSLKASGVVDADIDGALREYAIVYGEHCLDHSTLYPGVAGLLPDFDPISLAVVSNKPERACRRMLHGLGVEQYFFRIAGGDSYPAMKPSPEPILALATSAGAPADRVLMVGDSVYDIQAAHAAGCHACAVTWGFQPAEMLKALEPEYTVSAFREIVEICGVRPRNSVS